MRVLDLAKTAIKYFFDIDPTVTEHVYELVLNQGVLLRNELTYSLQQQVVLGKSRIAGLMEVPAEPAYQHAA